MSLFGFRSDKNVAVRKIVTSGISSALVVGTLVCTPIAIAEPLSMAEVSLNLQATLTSQTLPIGTTSESTDSANNGEGQSIVSVDDVPTSGSETPVTGEENQTPIETPTPQTPPTNDDNVGRTAETPNNNDTQNDNAENNSSAQHGGPSVFAVVASGTWMGVDWSVNNDLGAGKHELVLGSPGITQTYTPTALLYNGPWVATYRTSIVSVRFAGPVVAPTSLASAFEGYAALKVWNSTDPVTGTPYFDTSNVTSMSRMFFGCSVLVDLSGLSDWNPVKLENASQMFYQSGVTSAANSLGVIKDWNLPSLTAAMSMFYGCLGLTSVDLSGWNVPKLGIMSGMFSGCSNLVSVDLSGWTTAVTATNMMFQGCSKLVSVDLSGWDGSNLTNMQYMFKNCVVLDKLVMRDWTSPETTLAPGTSLTPGPSFEAFANCPKWSVLDMKGWKAPVGTADTAYQAFTGYGNGGQYPGQANLTTVDMSDWDAPSVENMNDVFFGRTKLVNIDMSGWVVNNVTSMRQMFRGCTNLEVADLSNMALSSSTDVNLTWAFFNCGKLQVLDLSGLRSSGAVGSSMLTFKGADKLQVLTLHPETKFSTTTVATTEPGLVIPPAPHGGFWRTMGVSTDITKPKGSWWGTSASLLARNSGVDAPVVVETYVWAPPLGLDNVPAPFQFGTHVVNPLGNNVGLDASQYAPGMVGSGFALGVGSTGIKAWSVSAQLDLFTNVGGGSVPAGVRVEMNGFSNPVRTDVVVQPVNKPVLTSGANVSLTAGGPGVKVMSAASNVIGEGLWESKLGFNGVRLVAPPLSASDIGKWESEITWSLEDLP